MGGEREEKGIEQTVNISNTSHYNHQRTRTKERERGKRKSFELTCSDMIYIDYDEH